MLDSEQNGVSKWTQVQRCFEAGECFDISPLVTSRLGVFPGDVPFRLNQEMGFNQGHHLELHSIQTTLHIGAHADAPSHYHPDGVKMEKVKLMSYIGRCNVIDVSHCPRGHRIEPKDFDWNLISTSKILFKTGSFPDPNQWNSDFVALSPELIFKLAAKNVDLVGIDTPSVDLEDCKNLYSHQALFATKMAVLEGLDLMGCPEGCYFLMAVPLKLGGAEASPVRALLFK